MRLICDHERATWHYSHFKNSTEVVLLRLGRRKTLEGVVVIHDFAEASRIVRRDRTSLLRLATPPVGSSCICHRVTFAPGNRRSRFLQRCACSRPGSVYVGGVWHWAHFARAVEQGLSTCRSLAVERAGSGLWGQQRTVGKRAVVEFQPVVRSDVLVT